MKDATYFKITFYTTVICLIACLLCINFRQFGPACIFGVNTIVFFIIASVFEYHVKQNKHYKHIQNL